MSEYVTRYSVETGFGDVVRTDIRTRKLAIEIALDKRFGNGAAADAAWSSLMAAMKAGDAEAPAMWPREYVTLS